MLFRRGSAGKGGEILTDKIERATLCEKVADLDSYTHTALTQSNYVREQRYLLCAEIQKIVSDIMNLSIRAKKGYLQKSTLQNLDIAVDTLRYKIRESNKKGYITINRRHIWMKHVDEIGRMVGGWIKSQ